MFPFPTEPAELYNKTNSYFPKKSNSYKVAEILLDNRNRKWLLVDDGYYIEKNNFVSNNKILFEAVYTIDENGLRYTYSNENSDETFIFLGCSYVFGACINDNETLPYLFSKALNFSKKVINAGQDARGINRAYSFLKGDFLKKLLKESKAKYIFYEYMGDHIYRAFRYHVPSDVMLYDHGKQFEVNQPFKIVKKIFTRCLIYERCFSNFVEEISFNFYRDYIQKILLNMYNISKEQYDANFVVIMYDREEKLEEYFLVNGIDFIKAYEYLDYNNDVIAYDGHPNVKANKKIVDLLITYIKNKGEL